MLKIYFGAKCMRFLIVSRFIDIPEYVYIQIQTLIVLHRLDKQVFCIMQMYGLMVTEKGGELMRVVLCSYESSKRFRSMGELVSNLLLSSHPYLYIYEIIFPKAFNPC